MLETTVFDRICIEMYTIFLIVRDQIYKTTVYIK